MTCKLYSKAETAARDAVIQALHDNVDQETLGKLWDAYLGLRHVSENHTHEDDITITTPDSTGQFLTFGDTNIGDINLDSVKSINSTVSFDKFLIELKSELSLFCKSPN